MKKLFLFLLMISLPVVASADAVEIDGLYYNLITKGRIAEVTSNPLKYSGNVIIPEKVYYDGVEYSVAILGEMAFFQCTGLTSVSIPNSVTSMGGGVFYGCTGLTSITIPNSITSIEDNMFSDCSALTSVDIPNSVTSIGSEAFRDCCGLKSITIPTSVINIRGGAFRNCSGLTSVHISDIAAWCMISFEDIYSNPLYAAHHLYLGNEEIKDLTIPQNITSISQIAFAGCSGLVSVTIPNNITNIGREAFFYCSGLTSITIPNSITSIESGVFQGCSGLTSVDFPNNLKEIKGAAFEMCTSLTSVIIPNSVTKIGDGIFQNCSSLTTLTIGSGIKEIWNVAFEKCKELADVYCMAVDVPYTVPNAFDGSYIEFATLHVPEASISSYGAVEPWKNFKTIVKIDMPKHTLTYIIDGEEYKQYEVEEGETIFPEAEPTKEGYTFSGWSEIPETMPAEDIIVTGTFLFLTDVDEITIKDIGKTTWCSDYDLDFTNVAGIKAYTATGYNDVTKTIWLTRVTEVPAGTGLLVKGDAGTYKIPHTKVRAAYANWFVGNLDDQIKIEETDGDKTNYYLSGKDGTFKSVSGYATIGKNKAYLQLPTSVFAGTRSIGISYDDEDGTTSIIEVKSGGVKDGEWYTLQGQRVVNPGKGIYIHNGKKVVIK